MKVLVVFDEMNGPFFIVLEVERVFALRLASWHNHYINCVQTPDDISEAIEKFFYEDGVLKFPKVEGPLTGTFDFIIMTGIL